MDNHFLHYGKLTYSHPYRINGQFLSVSQSQKRLGTPCIVPFVCLAFPSHEPSLKPSPPLQGHRTIPQATRYLSPPYKNFYLVVLPPILTLFNMFSRVIILKYKIRYMLYVIYYYLIYYLYILYIVYQLHIFTSFSAHLAWFPQEAEQGGKSCCEENLYGDVTLGNRSE